MMTLRHFIHSHDHRWRRRIVLSLPVLSLFAAPCIDKGLAERAHYHPFWTDYLLRWTQAGENMGGDPATDLKDATSFGRECPVVESEIIDITGHG